MSVEAHVLAAIIEEGSPKKAFQAGITRDHFQQYEEEWDWVIHQVEKKRPVNWRRFQKEFDDFERIILDERLQDLCEELKSEYAYSSLSTAIDQVLETLTPTTAIEHSEFLREVVTEIIKGGSIESDVLFSDYKGYLADVKNLGILRENGQTPGIPTGIKTLDTHWGGLQNGRVILVLGRPGDAKSMLQAKLCCEAFLDNRRFGLFSPEMNEHEHRARVATLLSANSRVQEELGLKKAFRNRALLDGQGYNYKTLKRFWEWYAEQQGEIALFTQKFRRQKMTPAYLEAKIDDLGLEGIIIDPIYKLKSGIRKLHGWEEVQATTDAVCNLAEVFNIPVVMSNQANRQQGNRGDAPHKDASYNGDSPVQEADHVIGVKNIEEEKKLILRCTKNRHGENFRVDIRFLPNIGVMEDVSYRDFNYYNGHEDGSDEKMKKNIKELEEEMGYDPR